MDHDFKVDISTLSKIEAVPTILDVVCRSTGMGFAAVARVTEDRWIACNVLDQIAFGLKPGGELKVETTICHEVRENRSAVIINHVAEDDIYRDHHTPKMYGIQSYISMPIILPNGKFFGTLCAIDPKPAKLQTPEIIGMFKMFAELIAFHIDAHERLQLSEASLLEERATSELREQFIAVLGHDLRNPLGAISSGVEWLEKMQLNSREAQMVSMIKDCAIRMLELIENILDFARGRLGAGLSLNRQNDAQLAPILKQVVDELQLTLPQRQIEFNCNLTEPVNCDANRIAQLFSNLLGNALTYGASDQPISIKAHSGNGSFELSIANAGDKIPATTLQRLFQPFARGEVKPNQQGLGLGLYISSEIAGAHDGTLTVTSDEKQTCFTLKMPTK